MIEPSEPSLITMSEPTHIPTIAVTEPSATIRSYLFPEYFAWGCVWGLFILDFLRFEGWKRIFNIFL
jgi:hypothetical protein